jgi:NAD(P)-dependent dehydrogenase (short-subunit alcohol dehydrogenase family)
LVAESFKRYGRIDVLADTVGGYRAGTPVHETSPSQWDEMMALNARTAFLISRAVIPTMLDQGSGRIILTAARNALRGGANAAAYAASKAAVARLTESLAAEVKHRGINVNCVLPGTIDTDRNRGVIPYADPGHWVRPGDIAAIFVFLASDAATAIHGALIPAYGLS